MATFNLLDYSARVTAAEPPDEESAWQEHIPFAGVLVEMLRPALFVELGVHHGGSYLAFCRVIDELNLACACYGIDTFAGDDHAGHYGQEVELRLRSRSDARFGRFSRVVNATFDEALKQFDDGTIDLLHIDGLHSYEAARHDFESWLPKMSRRGVMLFHDIQVRERGFGVWRVWDEVSADRPHFAFRHGHGLGVLAVGSEVAPPLSALFSLDEASAERVRDIFFALGHRITLQVERRALSERLGLVAQYEGEARRARKQLATVSDMQLGQEVELTNLRRALEEAQALNQQLLESLSFRIGMSATAPLRWVAAHLAGRS